MLEESLYTFNAERADQVLVPLVGAHTLASPATSMPAGLEEDQAFMRHAFFPIAAGFAGTDMEDASRSLFKTHAEYFTEEVGALSVNQLKHVLKRHGFHGVTTVTAWRWCNAVSTVYAAYRGDLRLLIEEVQSVSGFIARQQQEQAHKRFWFPGVHAEGFSRFCHTCEAYGYIIPVPDAFPVTEAVAHFIQNERIAFPSNTEGALPLRVHLANFACEAWGTSLGLFAALRRVVPTHQL